MYLPQQFADKNLVYARELMRSHPFASLISNDEEGLPFVTHVPLHLVESDSQPWRLLGHCAKANPHWRHLEVRPKAVVTFLGPHGYLSPKVYPDLARVPSWNYLAVHLTVEARVIHEAHEKDALLKALIGDHEPPYAQQWRDLGSEFADKMLGGIVAFELTSTQVQCKLKLNQHRPEAFEAMLNAYDAGDEQAKALAQWMRRLKAAAQE
ncbi:transcriptional regulator [Hydrogenophaga crassostreae]|uniref:Transcriptional regulator n=1 Tax=Hydrogenophaga crassostreae TaxID=1763535 RepID=A0A163CEV3_9BURK|nr:FMN-binding negative transcriptional regulator [Hydrogenophaga crassostreae]AOW13429.1 transcriptional regulator [Hydrogenophaga crassostreae]OAD41718.1 transcriptional regulator [Hydrogenophaga crassostreae]